LRQDPSVLDPAASEGADANTAFSTAASCR
jgi:hypothetical protein